MAIHRIYDTELEPTAIGGVVEIRGDEAHHALRVKRVERGDPVEVLNGRGVVVRGRVDATAKDRGEFVLSITVDAVAEAPRVRPAVRVCSAVPKGPRLADLVDGLSQVGAAEWRPLVTRREQGAAGAMRVERLQRTAIEASKQCGRAWALELGPAIALERAIAASHADARPASTANARDVVVLADASGMPYAPTRAAEVRLLVGPEGGWTPEELAAARSAGVVVASFGPHVMRIETAAVVACAAVLAAERSTITP